MKVAAILAFPRAHRVAADLTGDKLLRRCRIAARVAGCNQVQRAVVERAAEIQIKEGGNGVSILTAARELAKQLLIDSKARR